MAITISDLIKQVPPEVRSQVEEVVKEVRADISSRVSKECELKFKREREPSGAKVPIRVSAGHPVALDSLTFPEEYRRLLLLAKYRKALKRSVSGVHGLLSLRSKLSSLPDPEKWTQATTAELQSTHDWAVFLLNHLEAHDPLKDLFAIEDDILGVYIFDNSSMLFEDDKAINEAEIKIYWGVVGLVAPLLDCDIKDLTIVTLTHELAHAYTQLGADIEGCRWPAKVFDEADIYLKEGLAQYYTDLVLRSLSSKYPGALKVYKAMLPKQPGPYRIHVTWLENDPEAVRRAMIEVRRNKEGELEDFNRRLNLAEKDLATKN